ncbi:MAG: glutamate racemase [Flavobacteriaceae bacterium]|nr:glutamate racemase [Flavobacteriaceae bacterium]
MSSQPIGVFDSGVGGITIWKEITQLLPNEHTIYLADSKHAPYGQKPKKEIIELSVKNTELLLKKGCKIIVVACNTATTNAISYLRETYDIPFIGIEPAIKPAALHTKTNAVGILATKGTLSSELFNQTSEKFASDVAVVEQIGEGLVPLIEQGKLESLELQQLLKKYLKPMLDEHIDYLVLGCSHYPLLIPEIRNIVGDEVTIIDSGQAVAKQTKAILEKNDALNEDTSFKVSHKLYTNRDLGVLKQFVPANTESSITCELLDF